MNSKNSYVYQCRGNCYKIPGGLVWYLFNLFSCLCFNESMESTKPDEKDVIIIILHDAQVRPPEIVENYEQ